MADENVAAEIRVSGRVQGVGYRFFTERLAAELGIMGWSRNMADGSVELEIEGEKGAVEKFVDALETGPRMARVENVSVSWKPFEGRYKNFFIKF